MKFTITKYPKHILWLDSGFIITMAHKKEPRTAHLLEFLKRKRGEYFLVEGDDTELKIGTGQIKNYTRLLSELSAGVSFLPYGIIEQFEFQETARAIIGDKDEVNLIVKDYIKGDPVREFERFEENGFVIDVRFNLPLFNTENKQTKESIYKKLLATRPKGHNIQEQQRLEADTPSKLVLLLLKKLDEEKKANPSANFQEILETQGETSDFGSNFSFVRDRIQWWRDSGGARDLAEALGQTFHFLQSAAFKDIPFNHINSILWGDIFAGGEALKESDYWDVKHISAVLPFCHIIFTDNRQRLRLEQYGLDKKYKVEVYSMQNIEKFFEAHDPKKIS